MLQLVPELSDHWQGATAGEIDRIQSLVERPLPDFYRWFLARMGRSMGPIAFPTLDFSAQTIIRCYEKGLFERHASTLVVAYESDEVAQLHLVYDLDRPARGDAFTFDSYDGWGEFAACTETFREMLVWSKANRYSLDKRAARCGGVLEESNGEVFERLDPCMSALDFAQPIPCGRFCRIYSRPDATMTCRTEPTAGIEKLRSFNLGAKSEHELRAILDTIASRTSVEVEVMHWYL